MSYSRFPPYVSVAQKAAKAQKQLRALKKKNSNISPVLIEGKTLAHTWWGKSWNENLERYADYSSRLGRGRSYLRHGALLDLKLSENKIKGLVQGSASQPYSVEIKVTKLAKSNWKAIRQACDGCFDSLEELLLGEFPKSLEKLFFAKNTGFFPTPKEINFSCSCLDWAEMCKHVAATLYGVGARLDDDAFLLFKLRAINIEDIISETVAKSTSDLLVKADEKSSKALENADLGQMFGIELDDSIEASVSNPLRTKQKKSSKAKRSAPAGVKKGKEGKRVKPTMLETLVKAVGRSKKGKSIGELQKKLSWSDSQVRNALRRAKMKGLVETSGPGRHRRTRE